MKETTEQRLKQLMSERSLKQIDILNMSKPYQDKYNIKMSKSHLSQYVNGKSFPDNQKLYLLGKTLGVSEAWLLGYNVPKIELETSVDVDILPVYNKLNTSNQKKVYSFAEEQLEEQNSNIVDLREYQDVYVQSKVSAGCGIVDLDQQNKELISYKGYVPKKYDLAFEVAGDSMTPLFEDGEIIFVEYDCEVRNGQIGVVVIDDEAYVKKMYVEDNHLRLVSLNKDYDDIIVDKDIKIVGRAII